MTLFDSRVLAVVMALAMSLIVLQLSGSSDPVTQDGAASTGRTFVDPVINDPSPTTAEDRMAEHLGEFRLVRRSS